jgi:hypothetical protein
VKYRYKFIDNGDATGYTELAIDLGYLSRSRSAHVRPFNRTWGSSSRKRLS